MRGFWLTPMGRLPVTRAHIEIEIPTDTSRGTELFACRNTPPATVLSGLALLAAATLVPACGGGGDSTDCGASRTCAQDGGPDSAGGGGASGTEGARRERRCKRNRWYGREQRGERQ